MLRRLAVLFAAALLAAPAAAADGPGPLAQQGGDGVLSPDGTLRYVALPVSDAQWTAVTATSTSSGRTGNHADLNGSWGIPTLNGAGPGLGLSADGRRLVLAETSQAMPSKFVVYDPRTMQFKNGIVLKGSFTFDAISPDGSRVYLIQHMASDVSRYVVRAYDLERQQLLPGRIADRTQKGWVMQGYPLTRTTSADGRMVYTLYQNSGGYPFVHALDTVAGVAHCVGIPFAGDQGMLFNIVLSLHGKTLAVHWRSGRPWYAIDTTTWRIAPAHRAFPWLWVAVGGAAPLLAAAAFLLRRRRRQELDKELSDLLRLPKREVVV
jgi:hypothetical protein